MTRFYRRRRGDRKDSLKAAAVALGVGTGVAAVTFYFTRLFLVRELLAPPERDERTDGGREGGDAIGGVSAGPGRGTRR